MSVSQPSPNQDLLIALYDAKGDDAVRDVLKKMKEQKVDMATWNMAMMYVQNVLGGIDLR